MNLNTIKPALGSNSIGRRVGRGIGCGFGKTCGRGHKGQKSRAGGYHKVGFEGGQMPFQRRLPKRGFASLNRHKVHQVRLSVLNNITEDVISIQLLREKGIISSAIKRVKVYLVGDGVDKKLTLQGIAVTSGAKTAIEAAGGKVE